MTRRWLCIVLATLCLLALAASASADCAWVLWNNLSFTDGPTGQLTISGAFETLADCQAAARRAYEMMGTPPDMFAVSGNGSAERGPVTYS